MGLQELLKDADDAIKYIRKSSIGTPKTLFFDVTVANRDLELNLTGNFFYIFNSAQETDTITVKFNEQREPGIPLVRQTGFFTPFYRLFITNAAQAGGNVTILYGSLARPFVDIIDNRSPISIPIQLIRDELRGDLTPKGFNLVNIGANPTLVLAANANRKSLIIQALHANAGDILLGLDNTVAVGKYFVRLLAGNAWTCDDYRGDVYAHALALNDDISYGEV